MEKQFTLDDFRNIGSLKAQGYNLVHFEDGTKIPLTAIEDDLKAFGDIDAIALNSKPTIVQHFIRTNKNNGAKLLKGGKKTRRSKRRTSKRRRTPTKRRPIKRRRPTKRRR